MFSVRKRTINETLHLSEVKNGGDETIFRKNKNFLDSYFLENNLAKLHTTCRLTNFHWISVIDKVPVINFAVPLGSTSSVLHTEGVWGRWQLWFIWYNTPDPVLIVKRVQVQFYQMKHQSCLVLPCLQLHMADLYVLLWIWVSRDISLFGGVEYLHRCFLFHFTLMVRRPSPVHTHVHTANNLSNLCWTSD